MQKLLSTLFTVVFSFSIIVPSTSAAPSLLTYEDQELGFKLRYPSSMQVSKTPFEDDVIEVSFMTGKTKNFLVWVNDFAGGSNDVRSWDTSSITAELKTLEQESTVKKIYSQKVIKVGKQDAYISTYLITNRQTKKSSNAVFVATSANGKLYRMKYSYKDKDVNAASIYVDMMRSIQFFVGTLSTTTNSSSSSEQDVQNSNQSSELEEQKIIPEEKNTKDAIAKKTYVNTAYGMSFTYPESRTLSEEDNDGFIGVTLEDEIYLLYITVSDPSKEKGALDLVEIANVLNAEGKASLQKDGATNIKLASFTKTIKGNKARYTVFTMQNKDGQAQVIVRITMLINNRAYVFNMWADTEADAKLQMQEFLKNLKLPKNRITSSKSTNNTSENRSNNDTASIQTYSNTAYEMSFTYSNNLSLSEEQKDGYLDIILRGNELNVVGVQLVDLTQEKTITSEEYSRSWIYNSEVFLRNDGKKNIQSKIAKYNLRGMKASSVVITTDNGVITGVITIINNRGYIFYVLANTEADAKRQMENFLRTVKLPKDNGTQSSEKSTV